MIFNLYSAFLKTEDFPDGEMVHRLYTPISTYD
jgi:hypothetical protein